MKSVEIKSPKSLDLKNIVNSKENISILQTVDVFDKITINSYPKGIKKIFILSDDELSLELKYDIEKIINLFLKYANIEMINLEIRIEKNELNLIDNYYNIIAGILVGLNAFFHGILHKHELIYLGKSINYLVGYYIECGYKKIENNKFYNNGENNYYKYFIFEDVEKEELIKIKNRLIEINKENIVADFSNDYFFVALSNSPNLRYHLTYIPIKLKRDFKNIKITTAYNVNESKVLVKYL